MMNWVTAVTPPKPVISGWFSNFFRRPLVESLILKMKGASVVTVFACISGITVLRTDTLQ